MPCHRIANRYNAENPWKRCSPAPFLQPARFVFVWLALICFARCAAGSLQLSSGASSLSFGDVAVGSKSTKAVTLVNSGTGDVRLVVAGVAPSSFSFSGLALPMTLAPKATVTFDLTFAPKGAGTVTGRFMIDCTTPSLVVSISGTGVASTAGSSGSPTVSLSPTSLSFGNEPVDIASSTQTITMTNAGSAALTVNDISLTGSNPTDFTENNTCSTVDAGASCKIVISFTPSASGSCSASLSIADNASASPQTVALSGTGTHDVIVAWSASKTSDIEGYYVYRGTTSGGESSTPLNSTPAAATAYDDDAVQAGQTYYYKVATVSSSGAVSAESSESSATVP